MAIPFGALTCIVRGEVHLGQMPASLGHARAARPSVPSCPAPATSRVFRESASASSFQAYAAADLHFATVQWAARIDARHFDFSTLGLASESPASDLDQLVDVLAGRSGIRVDRGVRMSSVVSVLTQSASSRAGASSSQAPLSKEVAGDERFDPYSRVIGEAERLLAQSRKVG